MPGEVYNPLDKRNLGKSVASALLGEPAHPLPLPHEFNGSGIYAIYYSGPFPIYGPIAEKNKNGCTLPIYVGKAVPAGSRKGTHVDLPEGKWLYNRIKQHSDSIDKACNLELADFACRYLVVDDIWIPLGESLLIESFLPLWNVFIDGFGNHDPGNGRYNQRRSAWDTIHTGRPWALKCQDNNQNSREILQAIVDFLS